MRWSGDPDEPLKEVVRQQWNFSPDGSTAESEDYAIDLKRVSILERTIDPDRGAGEALAKLAEWRLADSVLPRADDSMSVPTTMGEDELRAGPLSFGAPEESHGPVRNPQPSSRRFRGP